MMENVMMTAEERREFEAYRERNIRKKQQREDCASMADDELRATPPVLQELSGQIKTVKNTVSSNFDAMLKMKSEVPGLTEDGQRSRTFAASDGKLRLTLSANTINGCRDTAEDGVAMVKEYIESLAKDETSKALVNAVPRLLSRGQSGNIKTSHALQLRKMAGETGGERFIGGVRIIGESYHPAETKKYIHAGYKNEKGAWVNIPPGMTDVE